MLTDEVKKKLSRVYAQVTKEAQAITGDNGFEDAIQEEYCNGILEGMWRTLSIIEGTTLANEIVKLANPDSDDAEIAIAAE